jgi:EpsI family protein
VAAIDFGTVPPPGVGAGWQKSAWDVKWTPSVAAPERAFFEVYGDGGAPVARFVALYVTAGLHNNLARGQNAVADFDFWSLRNSGSVRARIAGHEAAVTTTSIERRGKRLLIWSFYVVGNDIIGSRARVKLAQLRELFGKPNPLGAFVAIAADDSDPSHPAADTLAHFLESMPAVPDYFRSLTTGHAGGR